LFPVLSYSAQPGDTNQLTVVSGAYVLTGSDGTVEKFLTNGNLSSITDSNGNVVSVDYNSSGFISEVTSSNGQSLTFTTNTQGLITSATDGEGTYTYNLQNQMISTTSPSGTTTNTYDALGNLVSTDVNGVVSNYIIDPLAVSTSATGPLSAIAQAYNASGSVTAKSQQEIAIIMHVTPSVVQFHLKGIFLKLGVQNGRVAVLKATSMGLVFPKYEDQKKVSER